MKRVIFFGHLVILLGVSCPYAWAGPAMRDLDMHTARERREGARIVSVARGGKVHTVRIDTHAAHNPDAVYHDANGRALYLTQLDENREENDSEQTLRLDKKGAVEDASKILTHGALQKGHKKRVLRVLHKLRPPITEKKLAEAFLNEIFADSVAREMALLKSPLEPNALLRESKTGVQVRPDLEYDLPPLSLEMQREVLEGPPHATLEGGALEAQNAEREKNAAKKRAELARLVPDEVDKHLTELQNRLDAIRAKFEA